MSLKLIEESIEKIAKEVKEHERSVGLSAGKGAVTGGLLGGLYSATIPSFKDKHIAAATLGSAGIGAGIAALRRAKRNEDIRIKNKGGR